MKKLLVGYQVLMDGLEKLCMAIAITLAGLLFLSTAYEIIVNQLVGNSPVWSEEISNLFFAWLTFVGAGVIARHGGHIGVEFVYELVGPFLKTVLRVIYMLLALVVVFVMVYFGYKMALFVGKYQKSLYLGISLYYYYLSVPVGGVLLGLFSVAAALPDPRKTAADAQNVGV
ncbi:TRAP transporter small permease [Martelella soudanensis]|uniref:TRAP transporter small permease n=1 Tax=unclassified Martelella TaxID=2629616 RepID=UPI0015DE3358|nr:MULTISPECIES: TRAP transporter small permease [unclassified Martelella]